MDAPGHSFNQCGYQSMANEAQIKLRKKDFCKHWIIQLHIELIEIHCAVTNAMRLLCEWTQIFSDILKESVRPFAES